MSKKKPTKKKEEEEEEEEPEEEEWQSSASECATSGRTLMEEQSCLRIDSGNCCYHNAYKPPENANA